MTYLLRKAALFAVILLLLPLCSAAWAGTIDPDNNGSRYAWGENIGWINLNPSFGPGVTVTSTTLTGYAWAENIGWINLSPAFGGVINDTIGNLSGYAWAENVGWIKFNPTGGGVFIDACGDFNGRAWGENIGWISFRSDGANPFRVRTSWVSPLDTIPPVTTSSLAVQPWYQADTSFSLSATDCGTGVKELHYSINGSETIISGATATATVTTEGCNNVSYYAIDKASPANVEAAHQLNVCIDKTPPVITLTAPADNGTYYINTPATPLYTVTDSVSGVSATGTAGVFSTSQTGSRSYTVSATDKAGNVASVTHTYTVTFPGNVDPGDTGCQYAWAENVGWINFKPSWGPGVTVTDTAVTGKVWGENVGWINLSPATGGIVNNTSGTLSGYAWGENVGWINFRPTGGGVTIGADGKFSGYAWGENIGWINFSAANSCVKTAWVPSPTYSVTYNGNTNTGGSVPVDGNAYAAGATVTVLGNTGSLVKTGYTFAGWNTAANGSGTSYSAGATFTIVTSTTLYAQWTLNSYTVTFNSNGGSAVSSQSVPYNTTATQPTAPTKTGYTFAGWYSDPGLTTAFNFTTPITADISLYAKWTVNNYTVSFNSNGGSAVSSQSVAYNTVATQPAAPTKTGYTFAGWYSDAGLTSVFNFTTAITADTTLYAKWTINNYTVTFNSNGGSAVTSQSVAYNTTATAPAAPTKAGNTFAGWYSDAGLTTPFVFTTPITSDTTLYAKWTLIQYTLKFVAGDYGAILGTKTQTVSYGNSSSQVKAVPLPGFHLLNWTGTNGFVTTSANPLIVSNVTASQTITANFVPNYVLTIFVAGDHGGVIGNKLQLTAYGGNTSQVTAVPARGYHFVNWTGTNGFVTTTMNPLIVSNVTANQIVTANFTK